MSIWVKFTGEGQQEWNGQVVATVQGAGVKYMIGLDDVTSECVLVGQFDGPASLDGRMFGGRFTGPVGYVAALSTVMTEIATDCQ